MSEGSLRPFKNLVDIAVATRRPNSMISAETDLGLPANVSSDTRNLFQSDRDLEIQAARKIRSQTIATLGEPLELSSKVLWMEIGLDNTLFAALAGHVAYRIDLNTNDILMVYKGHSGPVTRTLVAQNSKGVAELWTSSWDKTIKRWEIETGKLIRTYNHHSDFVKKVVVEENGLIGYSCSSDKTIRKFNVETGESLGVIREYTRPVDDLLLTNIDGSSKLISASSDGTIRVWEAETLKLLSTLDDHFTSVSNLHQSSDGTIFSVSADKTARRWDLTKKKSILNIEHPDFVKSLSTILDGRFLITGCRDGDIRIFDGATGDKLATIPGHFDDVSCILIKGSTIYSASLDQTIRKWKINQKDVDDNFKSFNININESYNKIQKDKNLNKPIVKSLISEEEDKELEDLLNELENDI